MSADVLKGRGGCVCRCVEREGGVSADVLKGRGGCVCRCVEREGRVCLQMC